MGLFGGFTKPGKGVRKDAPKKKRFFYFFELYFRKIKKVILLNLLYILFCIPIITIGPATAAMTKIAMDFVEEKPVFLLSDFWDAFKANFKQGLVVGILQIVILVLSVYAFMFYYTYSFVSWVDYVMLIFVIFFAIIFIMASFYVYILMTKVELKVIPLLKNSVMLAFLGLRTNILTLIFTALLLVPSLWWFPLTIPIILVILCSTICMISCFNSFQYIYRYVIHPYYVTNNLEDPYEKKAEEEAVFTDIL